MPARPRILLLRRPVASDPFQAAFDAAGFDAVCVPVLEFEAVGRAQLAARFADAGAYGGLILTSPRAVGALAEYDLSGWRKKPTFVVGAQTEALARRAGLRPEGGQSGSAGALADVIAARSLEKPLLFVCGDRRRDALPDRLRAAGVAFEEAVAYRTLGDASALDAYAATSPDWIAFFSPSGVEAALERDAFSWNSAACASIGPTTAEALTEAGVTPAAVAASPTPEALVAAVLHAHRTADA